MAYKEEQEKLLEKHKRRKEKKKNNREITSYITSVVKSMCQLTDEEAEKFQKEISDLSDKELLDMAVLALAPQLSIAAGKNLLSELINYLGKLLLSLGQLMFYMESYYHTIKEIDDLELDPNLPQVYGYIKGVLTRFISLSDYYFELFLNAVATGKPYQRYLEAMVSQYEDLYNHLKKYQSDYLMAYAAYGALLMAARMQLEAMAKHLAETEFYKNKIVEIVTQLSIFKIARPLTLTMPNVGFIDKFIRKRNELQAKIRDGIDKGPFYVYFNAIIWIPEIIAFILPYLLILAGLKKYLLKESTIEGYQKLAGIINSVKNYINQFRDLLLLKPLEDYLIKVTIILIKHPYIFDYRIKSYLNLIDSVRFYAKGEVENTLNDLRMVIIALGVFLAMFQTSFLDELSQIAENFSKACQKLADKLNLSKAKKNIETGNIEELQNDIINNEEMTEGSAEAKKYYDKAKEEIYVNKAAIYIEQGDFNLSIDRTKYYLNRSKNPMDAQPFEDISQIISGKIEVYKMNEELLQ